MKKLLIGSTAMKHHIPEFNRVPKDIDFAVDLDGVFTIGEELLYNPVIFKYESGDIISENGLLNLKVSHLFFDNNWEKHMFDVQTLLKRGNTFNLEMIEELFLFWEEYLPKIRRSKLEMTKEDFFTNSVNESTNEHDALHEILSDGTPAYKKLLKDGCEVELDETKWIGLTHEERCNVVFEETAVMAYERFNGYYKADYQKMLKKCIIQHFPRWIALFAIENYISLLTPKFNYKLKIENGNKKQ